MRPCAKILSISRTLGAYSLSTETSLGLRLQFAVDAGEVSHGAQCRAIVA